MIFSPFERMVAARYLRARRREGFISIIAWFSLLGIALGVATLIIVMSVMNGFRVELMNRILGLNGHVGVYAAGGVADFDAVAERIRKVPDVVSVMPMVEGTVLAQSANGAAPGIVRGVRPADLLARSVMRDGIRAGDAGAFKDDGVMVGDRLAEKLGIKVGDSITLLSPKNRPNGIIPMPRIASYRVVAIFNVGMYEYDSGYVFMPLETAQLYLLFQDRASDLQVMVRDADEVPQLIQAIRRAAGEGFSVYDWQHANASFFSAVNVERNVMFLILTLIILVAAFNIVSSLIMLVKDKARAIAILRTMGATKGMITRIFFLSGASVGIIGTLAGVALGLSFTLNIERIRQFLQSLSGTDLFSAEIYFLETMPSKVYASDVVTVVIMSLSLSFLATIYPSWRAARLDPVEALRYE